MQRLALRPQKFLWAQEEHPKNLADISQKPKEVKGISSASNSRKNLLKNPDRNASEQHRTSKKKEKERRSILDPKRMLLYRQCYFLSHMFLVATISRAPGHPCFVAQPVRQAPWAWLFATCGFFFHAVQGAKERIFRVTTLISRSRKRYALSRKVGKFFFRPPNSLFPCGLRNRAPLVTFVFGATVELGHFGAHCLGARDMRIWRTVRLTHRAARWLLLVWITFLLPVARVLGSRAWNCGRVSFFDLEFWNCFFFALPSSILIEILKMSAWDLGNGEKGQKSAEYAYRDVN